ncbi:SidA/IucD/PvdA family monooxygenase [Labrys sp. KB_33_2]|uniref:SidA/IucD/PvdA family monooxygenase n=1 Tax=Labrys sp. KB_33_2 TaxID=3237479 RepID=UPI003F8DC8CD
MTGSIDNTHELVCIGFGPAAIAVAAAIEDNVRAGSLPPDMRNRVVFLEKQSSTAWQGGLLLPGTNINHNHYRDLATPRDPGSAFTFARYLKAQGRLFEHGAWSGAVSRIEWSDYVGWAAGQLGQYVRYGEAVESIGPASDGERRTLTVTSGKGRYRARQVMLACGMEPFLPEQFEAVPHHLARHAGNYLYYRKELDERIHASAGKPLHVAIVGSGLSAAEIMHDLLTRHESDRIHVTSLHRGLPFRQYDMSQFSNQIYMPPEAVRFSAATPAARRRIFEKSWATNFSGVDAECSAQEWNFLYERRLMGLSNATIIDRHEIDTVQEIGGRISLRLRDIMTEDHAAPIEADFVILATGYRDTAPDRLLSGIESEVEREYDGLLAITPDYRLKTSDRVSVPIWMNGHCEHTHGIADTQSFSLIAYKADRIFEGIRSHLQASLPHPIDQRSEEKKQMSAA